MAYNTRQKDALVELLEASRGCGLSAVEIHRRLQTPEFSVGRTTVYRLLDALVAEGRVRRYDEQGSRERKYEWIEDEGTFDVRCAGCRKIYHLRCDAFARMQHELREHLFSSHGFKLDAGAPLFEGWCPQCRVKKAFEEFDRENDKAGGVEKTPRRG